MAGSSLGMFALGHVEPPQISQHSVEKHPTTYVTEAKGFFKAEGIEHETGVIAGPTGTAAVLSGDVDYSGAGGSGMRAATKGAPIPCPA